MKIMTRKHVYPKIFWGPDPNHTWSPAKKSTTCKLLATPVLYCSLELKQWSWI